MSCVGDGREHYFSYRRRGRPPAGRPAGSGCVVRRWVVGGGGGGNERLKFMASCRRRTDAGSQRWMTGRRATWKSHASTRGRPKRHCDVEATYVEGYRTSRLHGCGTWDRNVVSLCNTGGDGNRKYSLASNNNFTLSSSLD